ncbi:hypothetical protein Phum_PHUM095850 [Pediculus humanus corporis]|uniref:Uncharacterized protein n=1 Tax=Pediculus humanus subsp. corporis TaxID=121224 RepID=E0VCS2_PEDHC|nr:uncharacterized protein Phum_PHUM095850 [Pediculus humanus corporis]EEB11178.1 hypothetical protein Phum_PHUM095850 [Pediculus humanus corporis]
MNEKQIMINNEKLADKTFPFLLKRKFFKRWISFMSWRTNTIIKFNSDNGYHRIQKNDVTFNSLNNNKTMRREPMIPDYLKRKPKRIFDEDFLTTATSADNNETFRVYEPVNKRLPFIRQTSFPVFDVRKKF